MTQPIEEGVTELVPRLRAVLDDIIRAAEQLHRNALVPTSIKGERPSWPKLSDLDIHGRVWAFNPVLDHWELTRLNPEIHSHHLHARALPRPSREVAE